MIYEVIPFYQDTGYLLAAAISMGGGLFSILGWYQARKAKREATFAKMAAKSASDFVSTLSVKENLEDIVASFKRIDYSMKFKEASDIFLDAAGKFNRIERLICKNKELIESVERANERIRNVRKDFVLYAQATMNPAVPLINWYNSFGVEIDKCSQEIESMIGVIITINISTYVSK